ncbi:superoxide dismutase [Ancylobacter moscoviensis]
MLNRRTLLAASGAALAASTFARPHIARAAAPFVQPPLPYDESALAPTISARTVGLHYGKHHKGYFDKLNALTAGTPYADLDLEAAIRRAADEKEAAIFNNAGQAWNHNFYWQQFTDGPAAPPPALVQAAERDFGGIDALKKQIVEVGSSVFGSGWVWLVEDGDTLAVVGLKDAGNPVAEKMRPLLGIDVWEHAYYLDWENRRPAHIQAVLDERVNWSAVGERLGA